MKTKHSKNHDKTSPARGARPGMSRRRFLAAGALAGIAPLIIPSRLLGGEGAPSNRITLGMIGCGGEGTNNVNGFLAQTDAQILAVCETDSVRLARAKQRVENKYAQAMTSGAYKGCDAYADFRQIIGRKDIDAVVISTPDHWHVIPSIMAARAGKDVFVEKPMTTSVEEGKILCKVIADTKRVLLVGSEQRGRAEFHLMAEIVRNGRVGKLKHIEVGMPGGHSINANPEDRRPQLTDCDPPAQLDYTLWMGKTPVMQYFPGRTHWNWRWSSELAGGNFADYAHHLIDIAQWAHGTEDTLADEVEGTGTFPTEGRYHTPTQYNCTFTFADGVTMTCKSGSTGHRFEGTEGVLINRGWGTLSAEPASILDFKAGSGAVKLFHPLKSPNGGGPEHRNFLDCVKSREKTYAHEGLGHRAASFAHIGTIAMKLGRKLKWDTKNDVFIGDDEANKMLSRPEREPWTMAKALA
jgi:predicted dehydrogenase